MQILSRFMQILSGFMQILSGFMQILSAFMQILSAHMQILSCVLGLIWQQTDAVWAVNQNCATHSDFDRPSVQKPIFSPHGRRRLAHTLVLLHRS